MKQIFSGLLHSCSYYKYRPNDNWFFQLNYRKNLTQPNFAQLNFGLVYQELLSMGK
ncbi:hypothetical protein [Prevotella pallens]